MTRCANGHEMTEANSYRRGATRRCRTCRSALSAAYRKQKREALSHA